MDNSFKDKDPSLIFNYLPWYMILKPIRLTLWKLLPPYNALAPRIFILSIENSKLLPKIDRLN